MAEQAEQVEEKVITKIPPYARVKVYWDDRPENYSREGRNRIKSHFSRTYGVAKNNVNVVFRPTRIDKEGNVIEISGAGIDNIMDANYQRSLFKEWLEREDKNVDFERIVRLDEKVNAELDIDLSIQKHRKYELKWLVMNNFLCFGESNYVNFSKLRGLTIINSEPANQGGKTTFSVDAVKFLFFGKTTKTDKNEQVFNQYREDNKLVVRGMVNFDDKDVIIERIMTRNEKKSGGWTIKNKLNYYNIMPDGEEVLMEEEDATSTTAEIRNSIGSEADFDITILATAKNLEDLIDSTPTESGKLLTKFIGLEVIETKEAAARKMHNEYSKTMKSNHYDIVTLNGEIEEHEENVEKYNTLLGKQKAKLEHTNDCITLLNEKKDTLIGSKKSVDVSVSQLNPTTIESDIATITTSGVSYKDKITLYDTELAGIGEVSYDEIAYFDLTKQYNALDATINGNKVTIEAHLKLVDQLKNGEICPTCNRALEDVDHSAEIKAEESKIINLETECEVGTRKLVKLKSEIDGMTENKTKVDRKNNVELEKAKAEVEIGVLRNKITEKKADLNKYKANEDAINHNIEVDAEIEHRKTELLVKGKEKDDYIRAIQSTEGTIEQNSTHMVDKAKLITTIKKELEVDRIFKIYIEMIGKKGISKLVLRSVLPIINSELYRLMEDVVDFDVELSINHKNEVEFTIEKDEVTKPLKSGSGLEKTAASLALRCVLGKMSHLPMPNFITFDEVFGKVADVNIEKLKPMFDKIREMFDIVLLITMRDFVKDWGDNIVTVKKTDNISNISVK